MRYVSAVCVYKNNMIYNLTCMAYTGEHVTLIRYTGENPKPYKFDNFNELYLSILNILKENNFRVKYTEQFGRKFYNISFIDMLNPTSVSKLGCSEK